MTADDTGAVNTITASVTPAITAYSKGQTFEILVNNTNTGATTVNMNGLGVQSLKTRNSRELSPGEIANGQYIRIKYDGTDFQLISQRAKTPFDTVILQRDLTDATGTVNYAHSL